MNQVVLIGNLTRDPELGTTASGVNYSRFAVAVNRPYANASGEHEADFFNITAWRELADLCGKYLFKGNKVGIVGGLQTRSYESDGVKKYVTDIIADKIEFLTPKSKNDIPEPPPSKAQPAAMKNGAVVVDEDMPF